jgi:hypothetical protein
MFIGPQMLIVEILDSILCEPCFISKYHKGKEVRIYITVFQELLAEQYSCNLVVARPVHTANGRNTAGVLAALSRESNEQHPLALIPFVC